MPKKLTQEEFEEKVREIDTSFKVIGKYEGYYYPDGKPRKIALEHECGYTDDYSINKLMGRKVKCRKCNNLIPMTQEEYESKVESLNTNIKIVGKYRGTNKPVDTECKICGYNWSPIANTLYEHGCPVCSCVLKTPEMFYKEIEEKFPGMYEFVTEYKGVYSDITVINKFCNHKFTTKAINISRGECKCPYCNGKKVLVGFNDLWTTHPEIAKMLKNSEDGYKVTYNSGKKLEWICPDCGTILKKVVYSVVNSGLKCNICSDNIPLGEKIMYSVLNCLNINFDYQAKFDWDNTKKYDFYIKKINTIIEVNGIQHYEERLSFTHTPLKEIQENDMYKFDMAKKNGISNYIYINASSSDFVEIKENIIKSKLSDLIPIHNLSDGDWINIAKKTYKSFFVSCVNFWNEGWCVNQIHEETKLSNDTIRKYLISANRLNMCDYNTSEARSRWRKYYEQCKQ